ncbi:MAG: hypothetical protein K6C31_00515 [Bacteroidales bacterium]|nr:hypothetical protein [Bacteroidales bacterium]
MQHRPYKEIESLESMDRERKFYRHTAFQDVDFSKDPSLFEGVRFCDCCFLGCTIPDTMLQCISSDSLILPDMDAPYRPFISGLYTPESLYHGYDPERPESAAECFDRRVYDDYIANGKTCGSIKEALCRCMHDFSMSDALEDFLEGYDRKKIVAIMGGHSMLRTDDKYRVVASIAKTLTEKGRLMVSGGGPGAMEATHLGAWMAGRSEEEFDEALRMLVPAPTFRDEGWLETVFEVRSRFPRDERYCSIGIPTWLYGHEPTTPFASHIAKFFDNSIRENFIISVPLGGIIFSPGSAGTVREIFQDAEQNHYRTLGVTSPMIFLGREYYTETIPIHPLLEGLSRTGRFQNLILSITDNPQEAVRSILEN